MTEPELTALNVAETIENTEFTEFSFYTEAEGNENIAHIFCETPSGCMFRIVITRDLEISEDEEDVF